MVSCAVLYEAENILAARDVKEEGRNWTEAIVAATVAFGLVAMIVMRYGNGQRR